MPQFNSYLRYHVEAMLITSFTVLARTPYFRVGLSPRMQAMLITSFTVLARTPYFRVGLPPRMQAMLLTSFTVLARTPYFRVGLSPRMHYGPEDHIQKHGFPSRCAVNGTCLLRSGPSQRPENDVFSVNCSSFGG
jgi:hypothetical protein